MSDRRSRAVAAPNSYDGGRRAGAVYVIFGGEDGFGEIDGTGRRVIDLKTFDPDNPDYDPQIGFTIIGDADFDYAGESVSAAGDINGDGFDDIIIGAPGGDNGGVDAGQTYVIYGRGMDDAVGPLPDHLPALIRAFSDESPASIIDRFGGRGGDELRELAVIA